MWSWDYKFLLNITITYSNFNYCSNFISLFFSYLNSSIHRRRKGTKLFLVAFYECNDDYELENLEHDRLYCSHEQWVGDAPKCMQIHDDEGEEVTEEEEEEGK